MTTYVIRTDEPSDDVVRVGLSGLGEYAKLASPHFTGIPTAPTAAEGTDTTQLATCAFVLANSSSGGSVSDAAFGVGWNGDTTVAPSKNAAYDQFIVVAGLITAEAATRAADDATLTTAISSEATTRGNADTALSAAITALVDDTAFAGSWNGVTTIAPSKNAVYDKIAANDATIAGLVSDTAFAGSWDGVTTVAPSKNAVYDKFIANDATIAALVSDTAFAGSWDSVTTFAPSKNAVYDKITAMISDTAFAGSWDGVTDVAPSKNAVYDYVNALNTTVSGLISDTAFAGSWDGVTTIAPSKNAVYDKFTANDATIAALVSDTAYANSWDAVTTIAPSKNAVHDKFERYLCSVPPISANWIYLSEAMTLSTLAAMTINQIYWVAFTISRRQTFSDLGARVVTNNAGNFQLAIYACSATGRPTGTYLAKTGSLSTASAGLISGTLGGNVTLDPGTYFYGINLDNNVATFTGNAATIPPPTWSFGIGSATAGTLLGANAALNVLTSSKAFGTWDDVTSDTFTEASNRNVMVIGKQA